MFNLTTRTQKFTHFGMTLALGATLFLSGPAAAQSYDSPPPPPANNNDYKCDEYKQVYAYTEFSKDAHQHLDVFCDEGYHAISCEANIEGKDDYDYNEYYVSLNDLAPQGFKKNTDGKYEHASDKATYWGCHIRANNNLLYFTPSYDLQYGSDFSWRITGYATCVPKDCVDVYQAYDYYDEYDNPIDY
jgi:hypothetical protein